MNSDGTFFLLFSIVFMMVSFITRIMYKLNDDVCMNAASWYCCIVGVISGTMAYIHAWKNNWEL